MTWNDAEHATNVGFADEEHKEMFNLVNKLYDQAMSGEERTIVGNTLDKLVTYATAHLVHEEQEMDAKGYEGLERHKAEHKRLIDTYVVLQKAFHSGGAEVTESVAQMVKSWLESHIAQFDMAYADTLKD